MAVSKLRSKRKATSGRYKDWRKKKLRDLARRPRMAVVGEKKFKLFRVRGGLLKRVLHSEKFVNVYNPKTKKYSKVEIKSVVENPANRHFIRRNVLTKGAVVETELGKAKITSRPGQEGAVNAVLI